MQLYLTQPPTDTEKSVMAVTWAVHGASNRGHHWADISQQSLYLDIGSLVEETDAHLLFNVHMLHHLMQKTLNYLPSTDSITRVETSEDK